MGLSSRAALIAISAFASLGVFTFAAAQVPQSQVVAPWFSLSAPLCVPERGKGAFVGPYSTAPSPMQSQRPTALD